MRKELTTLELQYLLHDSKSAQQILEVAVFPAVLLLTSRKALQGSQLLDIYQAARVEDRSLACENLSAWRNLQWLSRFKEWAIFGLIACPGTFYNDNPLQPSSNYEVLVPLCCCADTFSWYIK